eukprot:scaffold335671_cov42-Prasinocladus_malaysianus.AAC.1
MGLVLVLVRALVVRCYGFAMPVLVARPNASSAIKGDTGDYLWMYSYIWAIAFSYEQDAPYEKAIVQTMYIINRVTLIIGARTRSHYVKYIIALRVIIPYILFTYKVRVVSDRPEAIDSATGFEGFEGDQIFLR